MRQELEEAHQHEQQALERASAEAPSIFGHFVFRVMTGSMEPSIPEDSLIVVRRTEPSEIRTDDIISYYSSDPELNGSVNTHRVVSVEQHEEGTVFWIKGDANVLQDRYPATEKEVLGKVIFISYPLGIAVNFLSTPADLYFSLYFRCW